MKPLFAPSAPNHEPLPPPQKVFTNHRPKFINELSEVLIDEFFCYRDRRSQLSDTYEGIKAKLRYRFTKEEIKELAVLAAATVIEANHLCHVTANRSTADVGRKRMMKR